MAVTGYPQSVGTFARTITGCHDLTETYTKALAGDHDAQKPEEMELLIIIRGT
jgi:hypothetical protein